MKIVKEPLLHFMLLGVLIFMGYYYMNQNKQNSEAIVINQAEYDHLVSLWKTQWKRDPSKVDAQAIIERYIRQEVFYREALALNLDKNDEIVKRRLSQKMEAVSNDLNKLMDPPTEEKLKTFYQNHPEWFSLPDSYAFKQVVFTNEEKAAMKKVWPELQQGIIPTDRVAKMGLPNEWPLTDSQSLVNAFGEDFATALKRLSTGKWVGPIPSGFGWHYVYIQKKKAAGLVPYDLIKEDVAKEYAYRTELESQDKVFRELLSKYKVQITAKLPSNTIIVNSQLSQR